MPPNDLIPAALRASGCGEALTALYDIYDRIAVEQGAFRASASARASAALSCPDGCGICCEGFVPDVLPLEAAAVAAYILTQRPELAERDLFAGPPCPFYDADRPEAHCSIYPARPLICRLFAYSAVLDKAGEKSFKLCRHMPSPSRTGERSWSGERLIAAFDRAPPLMQGFAGEAQALDPDAAENRILLGEAIAAALSRVGLAMSLAEAEARTENADPPAQTLRLAEKGSTTAMAHGKDDDEPEPNSPAPRAA